MAVWLCVCVRGGSPPILDDSLKPMRGCFMHRFSLCARNPVCLFDLDLQEGMVWGFFSGDRGNIDCKEISVGKNVL